MGKKIDNFGFCDPLFRSGHIKPDQYQQLVTMKIVTVINLEAENDDGAIVRAAGLNYIYIPLKDKERPPDQFAQQFLAAVKGTDRPYWVHCKGGRHRTGVAVAIYRILEQKWTYDQAYEEMKKYGWYSWFGHGVMLDYVKDLWKTCEGSK